VESLATTGGFWTKHSVTVEVDSAESPGGTFPQTPRNGNYTAVEVFSRQKMAVKLRSTG
jgi:hypothetical protein